MSKALNKLDQQPTPSSDIALPQLRRQLGGELSAAELEAAATRVQPSAEFLEYARMGNAPANALGVLQGADNWANFVDEVKVGLGSMRRTSAGPDGMLPRHLVQLCFDDDDALSAYARYLVVLANGFMPERAIAAHAMSLLVPIAKAQRADLMVADGDGSFVEVPAVGPGAVSVRGIQVGNADRRMVAKLVFQRNISAIRAAVGPAQLALAPHGADIISTAVEVSLCKGEGHVVAIWDAENGYGNVSRVRAFEQLYADVKPAVPYVRTLYRQHEPNTAVFYDDNGTCHGFSTAEGFEQGCPLSGALYSLGVRASHEALQRAHPAVAAPSYVDDNVLLGTYVDVAAALTTALDPAGDYACGSNTRAKVGKIKVWSATELTVEQRALFPAGVEVLPSEQGIMVLGVPHGQPAWVRATAQRIAAKRLAPLREGHLLGRLALQNQLLLVRTGVNRRPDFLGRGVPPELLEPTATMWDDEMRAYMSRSLGVGQLSLAATLQMSLPVKLGGLGLTSKVGTSAIEHVSAWLSSIDAVVAKFPTLDDVARGLSEVTARIVEGEEGGPSINRGGQTASYVGAAWATVASSDNEAVLHEAYGAAGIGKLGAVGVQGKAVSQRALTAGLHREVLELVTGMLEDDGDKARMGSLAGAFAGSWLHALRTNPNTVLSDEEFKVALLLRLGEDIPELRNTATCPVHAASLADPSTGTRHFVAPEDVGRRCNKPVDPKGHHYMGRCANGSWGRVFRHDALTAALKGVVEQLGVSTICTKGRLNQYMEENFGTAAPEHQAPQMRTDRHKAPDLVYRLPGARADTILDTRVTFPAASATAGHAAAAAELSKTNQYTSALHAAPRAMSKEQLVPAVMESFGRFGTKFLAHLKVVAGHLARRASDRASGKRTPRELEQAARERAASWGGSALSQHRADAEEARGRTTHTLASIVQLLSVTLMRAQAASILHAGRCSSGIRFGEYGSRGPVPSASQGSFDFSFAEMADVMV